jgi:hypothetical protein
MATLHVTEYAALAEDQQGHMMAVAAEPAVASQTVTYTTTTQSSAFNPGTRYVYLQSDGAKAYVSFGTNPTATVGSNLIVADDGRFFGVPAGASFIVAVYDGSS